MKRHLAALALGALGWCGCNSDPGPVAILGGPDDGSGAAGQSGAAGKAGASGASAGQAGSSGSITAGAAGMAAGGVAGTAGAAGTSAGGASGSCVSALAGVAVAGVDLYGWPPYAVDGCRALVVRADGALVLRDLSTGADTEVAPTSEAPRRPALKGDVATWEATLAGVPSVRVKVGADAPVTLAGAFDHAKEPRASEQLVVFTAFAQPGDLSDSDVYSFDPVTKQVALVAGGPGQQRWADVSATHIAWADFSEDPDGRLDENDTDVCDVVLRDRATNMDRTLKRAGKQGYPQLGSDGFVVFLDWPAVHPEPKLQAYGLRAWEHAKDADALIADVSHDATVGATHLRPSTLAGTVTWVGRDPANGVVSLFTSPVAAPAPVVTPGLSGDLFAPVLTPTHVLLAKGTTTAASLTVVSR